MVYSMTGYGQANRVIHGGKLQIEIKSVNHRYCEIVCRLPREWMIFEDSLKRTVQQTVKRGRVDVFVSWERDPGKEQAAVVNWNGIEAYLQAVDQLKRQYQFNDALALRDVLSLPDVIVVRDEPILADESLKDQLIACATDALAEHQQMRRTEGEHLAADTTARIAILDSAHAELLVLAPKVVEEHADKLKRKLAEWKSEAVVVDEQRLAAEIALFAERCNIDEELTRLGSHLSQCRQLLTSEEPIGRKLDFLIQEMNREVNTIGSKANHLAVVNKVVDMKSELEKIREQVQNLE